MAKDNPSKVPNRAVATVIAKKKSARRRKGALMAKVSNPQRKVRSHVGPPTDPADYSCNWKAFCQTLEKKPAAATTGTKSTKRLKKPFKKNKAYVSSQKEPAIPVADSPPEVWFDDVDPALVARCAKRTPSCSTGGDAATGGNERQSGDLPSLLHTGKDTKAGKYVAIDCEFVGVGPEGRENSLARCSIVNHHGHPLYDKFVKPPEAVTDYRTFVSGVRPKDLKNALPFSVVQKEVGALVKGRVLVGHAIRNDLKALYLSHPKRLVRDTQRYKKFKDLNKGNLPGLKKLCQLVLNVDIQSGEHSSVEDAQATMKLYRLHRREWETQLKQTGKVRTGKEKATEKKKNNRKKKKKPQQQSSDEEAESKGGQDSSDGEHSESDWLR